jgi:hypothetical protein
MKGCFKCGIIKPASEFYRHGEMGDGRLGKCKECTKADVREHYRLTRPERAAYEKMRSMLPERKAKVLEYQKAGRLKHPEKYKARYKPG